MIATTMKNNDKFCDKVSLDGICCARETAAAMHHHPRTLALAAFVSLAALAGCNSEPETVVINQYDPMADELAKAPPRELPPSIQQSRTYRCRDNSLIYAEFLTNNTARVRVGDRNAEPTVLSGGEDGTGPYTGEGWSVSGSGEQVSVTAPGRGTQTCRA
jgi:hypothetical protein